MKGAAKQVERSITAANNQVLETQKANKLLESSQANQLRAYLVLEGNEVLHVLQNNDVYSATKNMRIRYQVKNVGQTPAYKVTTYKAEKMVPTSRGVALASPTDFPVGPDEGELEALVIGAGLSQQYVRSDFRDKSYTDAELADFNAGKKAYIFWGVVHYQDIFQQEKYLRFCRYFEKNFDSTFTCKDHNDGN
jgi:hypothetical protein